MDHYTVNYRPQHHTGPFAQTTATQSPATISGLSNGTTYDIFVTATNTHATSTPSVTVAAAPLMSAAQTARFDDVSGAHAANINKLDAADIFNGTIEYDGVPGPLCPAGSFCGSRPLLRWQMAVWLTRAILDADPTATTTRFSDVDPSLWWNPHVAYFLQQNITQGCRDGTVYCPYDTVSRAQMAAFLTRAYSLNLNAAPANFTDVAPDHWAYRYVNALKASRITDGCTPTTFCPDSATTRSQMATFIVRACNAHPARCAYDDPTITPPITQRPAAPTITKITPGPGTLTITWKHTDGTPRANSWVIEYVRYTPGPPSETIHETKTKPRPASGAETETHTLTDLEFDSHYRIRIRGSVAAPGTTTYGDYSEPPQATETDPAAVNLIALEITQGLQNWQGDITLVKGKKTVVRAFLEPGNGREENVHVSLQLLGSGDQVIATELPVNPNLTPSNIQPDNFKTLANAGDRRDDLNASANFVLTDAQWIGDAADSGPNITKRYRLKVTQTTIDCQEAVTPAAPCQAAVDFIHVKTPQARMLALRQAVPDAPVTIGAEVGDLEEQQIRLKSLMPVPDFGFRDDTLIVPATASTLLVDVLTRLEQARTGDGVDTSVPYLGVLAGDNGSDSLGLSRRGAGVAAWYLDRTANAGGLGFSRNVGSHEFGHLLELAHAAYKVTAQFDGETHTAFYTYCSDAIVPAIFSPSEYPLAYVETVRGVPHAMLGPMGVANREVWGLDTSFVEGPRAGAIPAADLSSLAVLDPNRVFSVMSYCGFPGDASQELWIDKHFYALFTEKINGRNWLLPVPTGHGVRGTSARDILVVSGYRRMPQDGSAGDVTVLPVQTFRVAGATEPLPGNHVLELLDASGAVVRSVSFAASVSDGATGDVSDPRGTSDAYEYWVVAVADPPDHASYRIMSGSETIVELARSASAPAVTVTSPASAQTFNGEDVRFSWSASDADGDDLTYTVQYSSDGGGTFKTISLSQTSTSLTVARAQLEGSSRARIRVIASDGTRSTSAESAVFTVANNPPRVQIDHPYDGQVFAGYDRIALDALARDSEDGALDASAITWSSSIDGALASIGYLWISTDDLSEGHHTLTASTADRSGQTATASVTILVRASNDAPAARGDTAYTGAARVEVVDVTSNDDDTEGDINPHSLAVVTPPSLGTATVARDARSGAVVIEYSAGTSGVDTFVYRVCDRRHQCSTAEVVVVAQPGA